ncbi:MAG TPA: T9SS type A sorting domain-containing protein [Saprospiraceae bacterium]|nr:T9SS type A sorting domain-containing protein [Saprospiraceae bacterium]
MEKSIGPALRSHLLILFVLFAGLARLNGQVFSDNFNTITSATWTETGQIGISPWSVNRSGVDYGARRNTSPSQLELSNDVTGAAQSNGWVMVSVPTTVFGAPYNPVLSANTGVITWTFNLRQIRTDPSGFDLGNYGVALILAGETATNFSTGNGYAVVIGQSGATDAVRLVSYVTGLNPNSGLTDILTSNGTLGDIGAEYLSIKVTYNPCNNNQWQLFVRNDGTTAFADPAVGALTLQGTASNNLYTNIPLNMMAAHWSGASGSALQTAFFDNITVSVLNPSIVLGANPKPCVGSTTTTLSYGSPMNSPTQYSIDWDAAANTAGFTDITNAALPVSPIPITIPVGAVVDTFSGVMTVRNTTTLCSSVAYPFSVIIKPCTNPLPSTLDWVLLQNGESVVGNPGCVSSTDCTNDMLCYGLRYTPLYTGSMTSYTTGFFVNCIDGINHVVSNEGCVMGSVSDINDGCELINFVVFHSSAAGTPFSVIKGVPYILHQVCFSIPNTGILTVIEDDVQANGTSIDSVNGGGPESDNIAFYTPLVIDSSIACAPLPLKWLSFTAARYDNLMSKLDWATADEINVSHFEIQRSNDNGRSFHTIDIVKASVGYETVNHYQYIDRYAENGKNFYRVRQVDFDQKSDVSPIRTVTFKGDHSFSINAWPNPVTDELTIDVRSAEETLNLVIVDISGRIVWKGLGETGSSVQTVDVSALGAGVYSLIAEGNSVRDVKKIVVMK